ncbi:MAG TPA: hypothetical protein VK034_02000 [Enhygromyxa sp.]|nr:hypothetical protein [Enhygromyxa sp.]
MSNVAGDDERDRDGLIEQAAGAHRFRDGHGRVLTHPAWADLDEAGRVEAFERALIVRRVERALDPNGLSATAQIVLARIGAAPWHS